VRGGQPGQALSAVGGEADPDEAAGVVIAPSLHQPGRLGAVDQLDGAVMTEQQVAGQVADGRAAPSAVAFDCQQQLMLGRSQADVARLSLGPVLEAAQASAEG
jgi:hypothetical protein